MPSMAGRMARSVTVKRVLLSVACSVSVLAAAAGARDVLPASKSLNSPFDGWPMRGKALATIVSGRIVWKEEEF